MKRVLDEQAERFIQENYLVMTQRDMAASLGVVKGTVASCMKRNKWRVPEELKKQRKEAGRQARYDARHATPQPGDEVIREKYLILPEKALAAEIKRSSCYLRRRMKELGLVIPPEVVERNRQIGRIKPGNTPMNKGRKQVEYMTQEKIELTKATRFKKGNKPHNTKHDGMVTTRRDNQGNVYQWIRIAEGKWEMLHVNVWKRQNGVIPEGMIIVFRDGDKMNCDITNLEMISREENMLCNSASLGLTDGYLANAIAGGKFRSDPEFKEILKAQRPDLIELKRAELTVKRTIKKRINEQQQETNG